MQDLVLQTHPELNWYIRRYGCNMRCLQAIVEFETGRRLSPAEINAQYNEALSRGLITTNCYVNDNNKFIALVASYLGLAKAPQVQANGGCYMRVELETPAGSHFMLYAINGINSNTEFNPDPALRILKFKGARFYG